MKVSAKDSNYFNKTKNFIVPRALEMLSLHYGLDGKWPNERYIMLHHRPQSEGIYEFTVLDSESGEMKIISVNVYGKSDVVFVVKKINFIER